MLKLRKKLLRLYQHLTSSKRLVFKMWSYRWLEGLHCTTGFVHCQPKAALEQLRIARSMRLAALAEQTYWEEM